ERGVRGTDRLPGQLPMTPASALHAVGRPDWLTDHLYFRSLLGDRSIIRRAGPCKWPNGSDKMSHE
ncbi:MAG: hypothetical protein M0Z63_08595, partial [Actinomycetota bacterium]|nr:hypothetical protein [Actinomycetota bacterium]